MTATIKATIPDNTTLKEARKQLQKLVENGTIKDLGINRTP